MRRKIAWLILFFVLGLAMVLGGVYNSHLSADKAALNDQEQASKDFLDFAVRKIELSRVSGEDVSKKSRQIWIVIRPKKLILWKVAG